MVHRSAAEPAVSDIIQMDGGYELQTFWLKTFIGALTGLTMTSLIGHLLEPLMSLGVDVR